MKKGGKKEKSMFKKYLSIISNICSNNIKQRLERLSKDNKIFHRLENIDMAIYYMNI